MPKRKNYPFKLWLWDTIRSSSPIYWIRIDGTNLVWSEMLDYWLDNEFHIHVNDEFTITIQGVDVWIANYPHSYGCVYYPRVVDNALPSRRCAARLYRTIKSLSKAKNEH